LDGSIEQREDGSVRLFIRGDLQFDSRDERIYHESLALPALALAASRGARPLRVLVIGGGDGLIARELFKSERVASVDLVDYDPQILDFARNNLVKFNDNSFKDSRLTVHVRDAWDLVDEAVRSDKTYDLIVSDLTVPEDLTGARFHTIEWYQRLSALVGESGVLSINACSPLATPRAYWSIFNSVLKANLQPCPYHVTIPSFSSLNYGEDWGFFVASRKPVEASEFGEDFAREFARLKPRHWLQDLNVLRELFVFPSELLAYQPISVPAALGSDVLLGYFYNDQKLDTVGGALMDALSLDTKAMYVPDPDTGKAILPAYVNRELVESLFVEREVHGADQIDVQQLLQDVVEMVPGFTANTHRKSLMSFCTIRQHFCADWTCMLLSPCYFNGLASCPLFWCPSCKNCV
jgi:spermidine synthase